MLTASAITQLFILFNEGDKKLITALKTHNPHCIVNQQWHFSIGELCTFYQFFYQLDSIEYLSFRKFLFSSPINHQLQPLGLCINIAQSGVNIDQSIYYLGKLDFTIK